MHARGKSDEVVVVMKQANERAEIQSKAAEESVERRASVEGKQVVSESGAMQSARKPMSGLDRLRQKAERDKTLQFTNLMHHINVKLLEESYWSIRRNGAVGIDGLSWEAYGARNLEGKLRDLHERLQSGRFRATPSKRVWIPKADGKKRPLSIAALEDKIVQQALKWVLEPIWEAEFKGFSYGFRPGRGCHNALDALFVAIQAKKVSWILDADIEKFFDTVDHEVLMGFIEKRVIDLRVHRLIRKFLTAGVSEEGKWSATEKGTPQGGILSPLLANIYLHNILDTWITEWRKTQARGEVYIVRYADDAVMGFQYEDDAKKCWAELKERMAAAGLSLHPEKTKLIEFGRFAEESRKRRGAGKPATFDFLGFTHICGRRSKDNKFALIRRTCRKRLRAKIKDVREKLFQNRHRKVADVGKWLKAVVQGHLNYFAVPGNLWACDSMRTEVIRSWMNALRRRSQKAKYKTNWSRMGALIRRWIPSVKLIHSFPKLVEGRITRDRSRMR